MKRPSIKSPCVADRHHSDGERIAELYWPSTPDADHNPLAEAAGCLVSLTRASNGAPFIDVHRCDPTIRVRVVWDNFAPMALYDSQVDRALAVLGKSVSPGNRSLMRDAILAALDVSVKPEGK